MAGGFWPKGRAPVRVAATTAAVLACALLLPVLVGLTRPVALLLPGGEGPSAAVLRHDFPGEIPATGTGYDGQQVYALARAFPHLDQASANLDAPRYRALRILHPALASIAPAGAPLVLALLVVGIAGATLAVWAVADVACRCALPPALGVVAALALTPSLLITTSEPLAYGLGLAGLALAARDRWRLAAVVLAAAALGRESALVFCVAAGGGLLARRRARSAAVVALVPMATLVTWYVALGRILGARAGSLPSRTDPLAVLRSGRSAFVVGAVVFALCAFGAWWWRHRDVSVTLTAGLFAAAVPLLNRDVLHWLALPRLAAPGLAFGVAAAWATLGAKRQPARVATRLD